MTYKGLTVEDLKHIFDYNKITGEFRWKSASRKAWNGQIAGSNDVRGYWRLFVKGVELKGHRVAWAITYGVIPDASMPLDHINGNTSDNRICNLKLCSQKENTQNTRMQKNNRCGLKGVSMVGKKFRAHITVDGKQKHLGMFDTKEEAHQSYVSAAKELGWANLSLCI